MSGLEIVGALASASQLAGQVLNVLSFISDLYVKIRDAPESIQREAVQAKQLLDIAKLIERSPSLQTDIAASILHSCRSEAQSLLDILCKILAKEQDGKAKKLWNAIHGITKEREILGCFSMLEREKSVLVLYITSIDSELLHTIHLDLVTVKTGIGELSKELPGIRDTTRNVESIIEGLPSLANGITNINKILPNLNGSVTTVHGELADVNLKVTAIHDMLPVMRDTIRHLSPQRLNTDDAGVDRSISQPCKNKRTFQSSQSARKTRSRTFDDSSLDSFVESFHHYEYVDDFERTSKVKYEGTCQWISQNAKFIEWYLSGPEGCNILWIHGAPGLGKSTLLTYVVQSVMDQRISDWRISLPSLSTPTVVYSFCNSQTNNTASLVISIAIHQLLKRFPSIVPSGYDFNKSRSTNPKAGGDHAISLKRKSPKQLWALFQHLAKESKANIIFVVDGLDECDRDSQQALLELLIQTAGNIKILISSRPDEQLIITLSKWRDISKGTLKYLNTQEEQHHINNDIDRYIQLEISRISDHRGYSKSQKLEIWEVLKNDRSGLFLPVVLMLKRLEVTPATHLTRVLKDSAKLLAKDLDHTYNKLLREMPDSIRSQPSAVFKYLMYAYSPLTVRDLALACSSKYAGSNDERHPVLSDSFICSFRHDVKLYGPILRVRQDDFVEFVHSSAKEYLLVLSQASPSSVKFLTPQIQAHCEIAIDCLDILISNSSLPLEEYWGRWGDNEKIIDGKILLPYALQHWYKHLRDATSHFTSVETIDRDIFLRVRQLANLWLNDSTRSFRRILLERCGLYDNAQEIEDHISTLQVFSSLGLSLFVENLLTTRVHSLTPNVKAALALAIKGGHELTVDILTNHFEMTVLEGPEFERAIDDAARSGQQNLLRKMVRMRKQEASEYASALVGAFSSGKREILDTLAYEMGDFKTRDLLGLTVIHRLFVRPYHVKLASQTAVAIAQYLVSCGADINDQDRWGNTALHYACQSPFLSNPEVIEGLLRLHSDPWRRNSFGWTPFHLAARYTAHPSSITILLQYGGPDLIEAKTNSGRTPLGFACQRDCGSLVSDADDVVKTLAQGANFSTIGPEARKRWDLTERCIESSNFRALDTSLTGNPANTSTNVSSLADVSVASSASVSTSPYTLVLGPADIFRRRTPIAVPFDGDSDTESNFSYITAPESP